jgi:transcription-repair coupling factor (superfamily II helicase)
MQVELIDRFGLLPDAAKNHMRVAAIKLRAIALGIEKVDASAAGGYFLFGEETQADPVALVKLVQKEGQIYRMQGANRLRFTLDLEEPAERFAHVERLLDILAPKDVQSTVMAG